MKDLADSIGEGGQSGSNSDIVDDMTTIDTTWSSSKISSEISTGISSYNNTLSGGYSGTLKDIADAIGIDFEVLLENQVLSDSNDNTSFVSYIDDNVTGSSTAWSSSKISSEISTSISSYNNTLRGGYNGTIQDLATAVGIYYDPYVDISNLPPVDPDTPRCILTINGNNVSSDYGYTLKGLHEVLNSDWSKYIKNGDYIALTTMNGDTFQMVFNIDTYYDENSRILRGSGINGSSTRIHHIDMISTNLIPDDSLGNVGSPYGNTAPYGYRIIKNRYLTGIGYNYLRSRLDEYYNSKIPKILKKYIYRKIVHGPISMYEYTSGSTSTTEKTGSEDMILPELWIPFRYELITTGNTSYADLEACMRPYNTNLIKNDSDGNPSEWCCGHGGYYQYYISATGTASTSHTSGIPYRAPLCFRFA